VANVIEPFVHILLFECSQCGSPSSSVVKSHDGNVEEVDSSLIPVICSCGWSHKLLGTQAKRHWVERWPNYGTIDTKGEAYP
jgi:hypothetical protein